MLHAARYLERALASAALTALVHAQAPLRPYCAFTKTGVRVLPQKVAFEAPYLQLDPPTHRSWLVLDIDRPRASMEWERADLPVPTFIAVDRENTRAHLGYALSSPVCTTDAARVAPIRYLAAVEYAYTAKIRADFAFSGPVSKNPLHSHWRVWEPANAPVYELSFLAEFVDLPNRLPPRQAGVGRNCELFDQLRIWAYSSVRDFWCPGGQGAWQEAVHRQADIFNTFATPLGVSEIRGIARSVSRYVWRRFTPSGFRQVQAERGRLGGQASGAARLVANEDKRSSAVLMAAGGMSVRAIAKELNVGKSTVARWVSHEAMSGNSADGD